MAVRQLSQGQVPDGMVANVPWGFPMEQWSDKMVERALKHLDETEGREFFPHTFARVGAEARERGLSL